MKYTILTLVAVMLIVTCSGCRRPYDTPEYETLKNNETGLVIHLEGY